MIGFRYHLVSLVAVFLALAVGLVLGTTQLSGSVLDDVRGQVSTLSADKRALQAQVRTLRGQVRTADTVTAALAPKIVAGQLKGRRVVLLAGPQADGAVTDGVQKILGQAGATVTGRVQLTDDWTDPRRAADLKSFVTGDSQPAGFQLPETDDAGVLGGALLSYVLLTPASGAGADAASVSQVLAGFTSLAMLRVESQQVAPADYAVVVTSHAARGGAERARVLGQLAGALDKAGRGAVVAGTAAAAGEDGLVGVVRGDAGLATAVSTVDDADTGSGLVSTVLALTQQADGKSGQYGVAGNADAPLPPT